MSRRRIKKAHGASRKEGWELSRFDSNQLIRRNAEIREKGNACVTLSEYRVQVLSSRVIITDLKVYWTHVRNASSVF